MPNYKQLGELAELAFLHKASQLGFRVSRPYGETSRYDFIVDWRGRLSRVQIKAVNGGAEQGGYRLKCSRTTSTPGELAHYRPREVDFLAGYVAPEQAWYIIPVRAFCHANSIRLHPTDSRRGRFERYWEAWGLLKA